MQDYKQEWKLVRRVAPGDKWHPANDKLKGTSEYGTPGSSTGPETFSVRFDKE
jgi:hypothetical protein